MLLYLDASGLLLWFDNQPPLIGEHQPTGGQWDITGMLIAGLIARGNQQKLIKLAKETALNIADNVIFLS